MGLYCNKFTVGCEIKKGITMQIFFSLFYNLADTVRVFNFQYFPGNIQLHGKTIITCLVNRKYLVKTGSDKNFHYEGLQRAECHFSPRFFRIFYRQ